MKPVLTAKQIRELDQLTTDQYKIPSLLLMESAAQACLRPITSHFADDLKNKRAQVFCGPGNNGGDGAALARILSNVGVHVDAVLFGSVERLRGRARSRFCGCRQR